MVVHAASPTEAMTIEIRMDYNLRPATYVCHVEHQVTHKVSRIVFSSRYSSAI